MNYTTIIFPADHKIVVHLTDGYFAKPIDVGQAAKALREQGVTVHAVGGSQFPNDAALKRVSSTPRQTHIHRVIGNDFR